MGALEARWSKWHFKTFNYFPPTYMCMPRIRDKISTEAFINFLEGLELWEGGVTLV